MIAYYLSIGLPILINVLLIVHCFRTGRNTLWIWAIAFIPVAAISSLAA